jgi:hypothetical protein
MQQESALFDQSGTRISVLSGDSCSQLSCVVTDCVNTCDWESEADQTHFIFVIFIDLIGASFTDFLTLLPEARLSLTAVERTADKDSCENAGAGPISPVLSNSFSLFGSTSAGAAVDAAPSCGLASVQRPLAFGTLSWVLGERSALAHVLEPTATHRCLSLLVPVGNSRTSMETTTHAAVKAA